MSVYVTRTSWRDRLRWNTWRAPLPYLFHRWDAMSEGDLIGWCAGFWRHSSAQRWADECNR